MEGLIYIAVVIFVFLVGREITLWYFRISGRTVPKPATIPLICDILSHLPTAATRRKYHPASS